MGVWWAAPGTDEQTRNKSGLEEFQREWSKRQRWMRIANNAAGTGGTGLVGRTAIVRWPLKASGPSKINKAGPDDGPGLLVGETPRFSEIVLSEHLWQYGRNDIIIHTWCNIIREGKILISKKICWTFLGSKPRKNTKTEKGGNCTNIGEGGGCCYIQTQRPTQYKIGLK